MCRREGERDLKGAGTSENENGIENQSSSIRGGRLKKGDERGETE